MPDLYTKQTSRGRRFWSVAMTPDGCGVEAGSGTQPSKLRLKTKALPTPNAAIKHYNKTVKAKLRDSYLLHRDPAGAAVGEVVFLAEAKFETGRAFFDTQPSGAGVLLANMGWYAPNEVGRLHLIEPLAATTTTLLELPVPAPHQPTAAGAIFHGADHAMVGVNGETWRVHLASGQAKCIASFRAEERAGFYAHHLFPRRSASGERALLFDAGPVARVVNGEGEPIFEAPLGSATEACWTASISPSGRRVVAVLQRRGTPQWSARIWNVDDHEVAAEFTIPTGTRSLGFAPDDQRLILAESTRGRMWLDAHTGQGLGNVGDDDGDSTLWAWSGDGSRIAVPEDDHVAIFDADGSTLLQRLAGHRGSQIRHLAFGHDGRVLYLGSKSNRVSGVWLG